MAAIRFGPYFFLPIDAQSAFGSSTSPRRLIFDTQALNRPPSPSGARLNGRSVGFHPAGAGLSSSSILRSSAFLIPLPLKFGLKASKSPASLDCVSLPSFAP